MADRKLIHFDMPMVTSGLKCHMEDFAKNIQTSIFSIVSWFEKENKYKIMIKMYWKLTFTAIWKYTKENFCIFTTITTGKLKAHIHGNM